MQTFVVRLRCHSPYLTPWRNSTLWGRLSWIVADGRLPQWQIVDWIAAHDGEAPPLVIGDGLPADAIPVPALYLATIKAEKKLPKTLPWEHWLELCRTGKLPESVFVAHGSRIERSHVVISRQTGAALLLDDERDGREGKKRGQLRTEIGEQPDELLIIASVAESLGQSGLETLFQELCYEGWGQGRTYGYGHIELVALEEISRPAPTGWVTTLGHCHPTDDLPKEGFWNWTGVPVRPHNSARKGEQEFYTTMLKPASSFSTDLAWLGRLAQINGLADYRHFGCAPAWPVYRFMVG